MTSSSAGGEIPSLSNSGNAETPAAKAPGNEDLGGTVFTPGAESNVAPVIHIPARKKVQIRFHTLERADSRDCPAPRIKGSDTSPYIVGPVILQDADISQAVRLLSEAPAAQHSYRSRVVQAQSTTSSGGGAGGAERRTAGRKHGGDGCRNNSHSFHITLEDASILSPFQQLDLEKIRRLLRDYV